jgi:two-component system, NtrC family, nitrogen regulation response regulator NtrX
MPKGSIFIVDDEAGIRSTLRQILEDEGYAVEEAESGEQALPIAAAEDFDVILLDVWLPGMDGLEVLTRLRDQGVPSEVLVISGHGNIETAVRATKLGAFDFIEKPLSLERVVLTVSNALKKRRLEEKNRLLQMRMQEEIALVGESDAILRLKEHIRRAAPTAGRVLIYGENGTGKELVARLIHAYSDRSEEPFIELNCAAIPTELIESELFGHRKGSFTGAIEHKKGKFLQADGGTLFLDEVGDMSWATQAKVLRVLQEQTFEPVGGTESMRVDVRVLAATNKHLPDEIAAGHFRQDLYYRLNVIPIVVPPLRERASDVPLLCSYYLSFFSRQYGKPGKTLARDAVDVLLRYGWPGNVRELRNLMEWLIIMVPSAEVRSSDLPIQPGGAAPSPEVGLPWSGPLKEAREAFEREFIRRALGRHGGNVSRTAEELEIERRHLYRRLATLGMQKESDHGHDQ